MQSVSSSANRSAPTSPSQERLVEKLRGVQPIPPPTPLINWTDGRVFTPGQAVGFRTPLGLQFLGGFIQLFHSGDQSQGLIKDGNQVAGASVSTHIHTQTARDDETKSTFIQYDKKRFDQAGADFQVVETNRKGNVNYQGGHFIDHKFSAGKSHTTEENYIPQHWFYNAPLKEYLVQRCEAFVEIPLYTPNPPKVGVDGNKDKSHPIPIGIILIQIQNNQILDVFYFPNNGFDYEGLKDKLGIKKDLAKNITPLFKLKRCFHSLLQSAMITDFRNLRVGKVQQLTLEEQFMHLMRDVSFGMTMLECQEEEEEIVQFASNVLHSGGRGNAAICLNCDSAKLKKIQCSALEQSFQSLGEFLVRYGLRNALKSEVVSIQSRLIFLNVIIDFITCESEVSSEAYDFALSLAPEFTQFFNELEANKDNMNQEELFYFANIYAQITNQHNHADWDEKWSPLFKCEAEECYNRFVDMLRLLTKKCRVELFEGKTLENFLYLVQEADDTLAYCVETGLPLKECFSLQNQFLLEIRKPCTKLLEKLDLSKGVTSMGFQSGVHRQVSSRINTSYFVTRIESLGYSGDEDE